MSKLRMTEICYPEVKSYFIALETYQCIETKWDDVDMYTSELDWVNVLIDNGINPFDY